MFILRGQKTTGNVDVRTCGGEEFIDAFTALHQNMCRKKLIGAVSASRLTQQAEEGDTRRDEAKLLHFHERGNQDERADADTRDGGEPPERRRAPHEVDDAAHDKRHDTAGDEQPQDRQGDRGELDRPVVAR